MAGVLGVVGPLVGIGSSLGSLFGGGGPSSIPAPQTYSFQNTGGADTGAYSGIGALSNYNVPLSNLGQYQALTQSTVNNPYASLYQSGANTTGAAGYGAGADIFNTGAGMLPDVSALLSMGFDPQGALYSRTLQQVQDQSRANNEAAGVGTTPYGAGLNTMATNNFNIDWQNNQLARGLQALSGAGTGLNSAASGINTGLATSLTSAGQPYNTFNTMNTNALGTLAGVPSYNTSAAQPQQMQIQDFLNYLAAATGQQQANTGTYNAQVGANNAQFGQSQILGNNLGQSFAGLAKGWGSPSNPFAGLFTGGGDPGSF